MSRIFLITGGARSGKSEQALTYFSEDDKKVFIATAEPTDDDMTERIRRHREQRDASVSTIEEPLDLAGVLHRLPSDVDRAVLDCLTVWLGNLMHHEPPLSAEHERVKGFFTQLQDPPCDLVIVTNEVGMGVIPPDEDTRTYRDVAGRVNQRVAKQADRVVLMVSGIPVPVSEIRDGFQ